MGASFQSLPQDFDGYVRRCEQQGVPPRLSETSFSQALELLRLECGSTEQRQEAVRKLLTMSEDEQTRALQESCHLGSLEAPPKGGHKSCDNPDWEGI